MYLDHFAKFSSTNNRYQNNWGSWEGSLSLASLLTLKNWIRVNNGIQLYGDSFIQNQGIPTKIAKTISDSGLASNAYMESLISVSLDMTGISQLTQLYPGYNLAKKVPILIQNVKFEENYVSYDYSSYTYNKAELAFLLSTLIPYNTRFATGLVKLLWPSESIDDISYGFKADTSLLTLTSFVLVDSEITKNQLLSMGCLFQSVSFLANMAIQGNEIYLHNDATIQEFFFGQSYRMAIDEKNQGLFCIGTTDFLGALSNLQLTANNLLVKNNHGILFNIYPGTQARIYLANSVFVNNTCDIPSIITARTDHRSLRSTTSLLTITTS